MGNSVARSNVQGVCKLCGSTARLCKSHYLGKALYRLSGEYQVNHPVVFTPKVIAATPRQMWNHLLCEVCEKRFNNYGEATALGLLYRGDRFPLLERMRLAVPISREATVTRFSGRDMGIDAERLAYFALSLLWRGSVNVWKTLEGQTTSVALGVYEEPIRQYLVGETSFPEDAYVIVTACIDLGSQCMILAPWEIPVDGGVYRQFEILTRGLWFRIVLGKEVPAGLSNLCTVHSSKQIMFTMDCTTEILHAVCHFFDMAEDTVKLERFTR